MGMAAWTAATTMMVPVVVVVDGVGHACAHICALVCMCAHVSLYTHYRGETNVVLECSWSAGPLCVDQLCGKKEEEMIETVITISHDWHTRSKPRQ